MVDATGTPLDPSQVTINKEAGSLLFADPLVLQDAQAGALTLPLSVVDRIEQMSVVSDVQINGDLSIIAPLEWDFPAGSTVSSAVVYGDLQARTKNIFTQRTWNSSSPNWTKERIGSDTTSQYNLINNPIQIENKGAIVIEQNHSLSHNGFCYLYPHIRAALWCFFRFFQNLHNGFVTVNNRRLQEPVSQQVN